jgi:RNA polymerase subunit RPABC4/transcription elongation factor Spt4
MTSRDSTSSASAALDSDGLVGHLYCPNCERTVRGEAAFCPNCGTPQTEPVPSGTPTPSSYWSDLVLLGMLAWVGVLLVVTVVPRGPPVAALVHPVTVVGSLGVPLAGYLDMAHVRERTDWDPEPFPWLVGLSVWFVNIVVAAVYLRRRGRALRWSDDR